MTKEKKCNARGIFPRTLLPSNSYTTNLVDSVVITKLQNNKISLMLKTSVLVRV